MTTELQILRMGDVRLYQVAKPVTDFNDQQLQDTLDMLIEFVRDKGYSGIAAPQIGISQRFVIYCVKPSARYPDAEPQPLTVLINPIITPLSDTQVLSYESCLSLPGLLGKVPRYQHIRVNAFDRHGQALEFTAQDRHAMVVQHEIDHLDGILYPARLKQSQDMGFIEEMLTQNC